jgi:CheY-like chemotaxis protein
MAAGEPFAVIVSDMQMPGMNGATLLAKAHDISPDTVQLILSGQADLTSTIAAVNDANLFRFLTKPCDTDVLSRAVEDGLRQYQLVTAEKELIERTLNGAVEVLTELIATTSPLAFARTARVRALTDAVSSVVRAEDAPELRLASMLSQIGCVAIPGDLLERVVSGQPVSDAEASLFAGHPRLAQEMLRRIPRLERVADWVGDQPTDVDEARPPAGQPGSAGDGFCGEFVFATVVAFLAGTEHGRAPAELRRVLVAAGFPELLVNTVGVALAALDVGRVLRLVTSAELQTGMILHQDVVTSGGLTLLRSGEPVTSSLAIRLRHFANTVGLVEPIAVLVEHVAA